MDVVGQLTPDDREMLAQRVLNVYQADPNRLRKWLPEVSDLLDGLLSTAPNPQGNRIPFGLTQRERDFHKEALDSIFRRFKSITVAEAVQGLEHGANLLFADFNPDYQSRRELRQELVKLVRKATGIRPRQTGKLVEVAIGEGEVSRIVAVVRGLDLHLTWEFKLIKVTMNPNEWRLRCKALGVVGIGRDTAADVAENHDDYLVDAYENG
jgi:hypothetical protein